MLTVNKLGILLRKTEHVFESEGVLNPAVIKDGTDIHLLYRAVAKDNFSTIGYCKLSAPMLIEERWTSPLLFPESEEEFHGLEDPRIVKIEGMFYLSYTAYDGTNALSALASSVDLIHWTKHGIMVPQLTYQEFLELTELDSEIEKKYAKYHANDTEHHLAAKPSYVWDKNLVLFPRKLNNQFCFFHRIKPDIQIVISVNAFTDLTPEYWKNYFFHFDEFVVLQPKYPHEMDYVGGGCPPIETEAGWLIIYHGVKDSPKGYVYSACAALLDIDQPQNEIARLPYPLFFPEKEWELKGEVNNVCFPTGTLLENDTLYIYYGAADERIAVASVCLSELLLELSMHKN